MRVKKKREKRPVCKTIIICWQIESMREKKILGGETESDRSRERSSTKILTKKIGSEKRERGEGVRISE